MHEYQSYRLNLCHTKYSKQSIKAFQSSSFYSYTVFHSIHSHIRVSWISVQIISEPQPQVHSKHKSSRHSWIIFRTLRLVYKIDKIRIISALKYVFHYLPLKVASEIKIRAFSWAENSENVFGINKIYHQDTWLIFLSPCKRYTTRVG